MLIDDENDAIAIDKACEIKPSWNAAVCKGDVGRLAVGAAGSAAPASRVAADSAGSAALRARVPQEARQPVPALLRPAPAATPRPAAGPPFGRPSGPPQPPIVLSRNGKDLTLAGDTNVRAGTEIEVTTQRPSVDLRLSELDKGSWVIFQLPGFTTAASGTPQASLDALRKASATSYYKGKDALWVKVVSTGEGARLAGPGAGGTTVEVSR